MSDFVFGVLTGIITSIITLIIMLTIHGLKENRKKTRQ